MARGHPKGKSSRIKHERVSSTTEEEGLGTFWTIEELQARLQLKIQQRNTARAAQVQYVCHIFEEASDSKKGDQKYSTNRIRHSQSMKERGVSRKGFEYILKNQGLFVSKVYSQELFKKLNVSGTGFLTVEEFVSGVLMGAETICLIEDRPVAKRSEHFLTEIPSSLKAQPQAFSSVIRQIQDKVQQGASSRAAQYKHIITLFSAIQGVNPDFQNCHAHWLTRSGFGLILRLLGMVLDEPMIDVLFKNFDVNDDGHLTLAEFFSAVLPPDYTDDSYRWSDDFQFEEHESTEAVKHSEVSATHSRTSMRSTSELISVFRENLAHHYRSLSGEERNAEIQRCLDALGMDSARDTLFVEDLRTITDHFECNFTIGELSKLTTFLARNNEHPTPALNIVSRTSCTPSGSSAPSSVSRVLDDTISRKALLDLLTGPVENVMESRSYKANGKKAASEKSPSKVFGEERISNGLPPISEAQPRSCTTDESRSKNFISRTESLQRSSKSSRSTQISRSSTRTSSRASTRSSSSRRAMYTPRYTPRTRLKTSASIRRQVSPGGKEFGKLKPISSKFYSQPPVMANGAPPQWVNPKLDTRRPVHALRGRQSGVDEANSVA
eukprot:983348_1